MSDHSAIEWTNASWNPVTGCSELSAGCDHCYAKRFSERFRGVAGHPFESGFDLRLRPERLDQPARWRRPRLIFVNSMSDLFHKNIPADFLGRVFDTMEQVDRHVYQVLTKRSSLMRSFVNRRYAEQPPPAHIWLGVSIEDASTLGRLRHLQQTRAAVRFVSFEPLLGPIGAVDLTGIHWVIAGGESGPGARPVDVEWLREIRDRCQAGRVAFFFKQWGGRSPKSGGNELDGRQWLEYPSRVIKTSSDKVKISNSPNFSLLGTRKDWRRCSGTGTRTASAPSPFGVRTRASGAAWWTATGILRLTCRTTASRSSCSPIKTHRSGPISPSSSGPPACA